jgi:shikimate kinase
MIFSLIGPRGAGKTTISKRLAELTGWPRVATDEEVEKIAQRPPEQIIAEDGIETYLLLEKESFARCIARHDETTANGKGMFLDVGGSLILDPAVRERLRRIGEVIYLQAPPEILAARLHPTTEAGPSPAEMRRLIAERDAHYLEAAHLEVDTHDLGIEASVTVLMNWVAARCGICDFRRD